MKTKYENIEKFITKDGSIIRELMHPDIQGDSLRSVSNHFVKNQSLAEATVPVGTTTLLHKHSITEELYHITSGKGLMTLDGKQFNVTVGDTICIPPESPHNIKNTGDTELRLLCCCSPAYSHDDTHIISS